MRYTNPRTYSLTRAAGAGGGVCDARLLYCVRVIGGVVRRVGGERQSDLLLAGGVEGVQNAGGNGAKSPLPRGASAVAGGSRHLADDERVQRGPEHGVTEAGRHRQHVWLHRRTTRRPRTTLVSGQ